MDRPADGLNSLSRCRAIAVARGLSDRSGLGHGLSRDNRCGLNRRAAAGRAAGRGLSLLAVASFAASMAESLGVRTDQGQNHGKNHNSHHAFLNDPGTAGRGG
jgi:hypothetical protein